MAFEYCPTYGDVTWLSRAVHAEGEPYELVAAALVNRFMFLGERRRGLYETLTEFVQAYSTPVNPRLCRAGDRWEKLYAEAKTPERRKMLEELSYRRVRHAARNVFFPAVSRAVRRALTSIPELPTVTDFAAHDHPPSAGLTPVVVGRPGINSLYAADPAWKGYQVGTESVLTKVQDGVARISIVTLFV